ncbi:MAG: HAMP domain-containing sensor histidine kinase [Parasulfuritortus sp.]|jgi:two-component system sensor histidine kinase PilS (NtrC family)|nr:HAMP domain-containing sensor histidine kinase [Parasulfuritortus sp.]
MTIAIRTRAEAAVSPDDLLFPDSFWRSLKQLNSFRFFLAIFFGASLLFTDSLHVLNPAYQGGLWLVAGVYLVSAVGFKVLLASQKLGFSYQLVMQLVTDIVIITLFIHFSGGNNSGLGLVLTVPMAAAGLHPKTRIMLFLAALASLAMLLEQALFALGQGDLAGGDMASGYLRAAMLSVGFFTVAGISHLLAKAMLASARMAVEKERTAIELERINAKVIQDLPYGVLVLGPEGQVVLHNQQAESLLGCPVPNQSTLMNCNPELASLWQGWLNTGNPSAILADQAGAGRLRIRLRELGPDRGEGAVVIVEDMSELEQEATHMKLAALGRLTANLAHEIRNPLSAINHASQLLREDAGQDAAAGRLTRIIEDNVVRLNYLVEDVLSLSRRDRRNLEIISLDAFLPDFIAQFEQTESVSQGVIELEVEPGLKIEFDRMHLHQILWNLLRNAYRHCSRSSRAIVLSAVSVGDMLQIEIYNDGPSIPADMRQRLFEPFYSTDRSGTGLGLYIALEMADANGGQLRCVEQAQGARFRLSAKLQK